MSHFVPICAALALNKYEKSRSTSEELINADPHGDLKVSLLLTLVILRKMAPTYNYIEKSYIREAKEVRIN